MNYRQWKKKYKKEHGHNPLSRRKLRKIEENKKAFDQALANFSVSSKEFHEAMVNLTRSLCNTISVCSDNLNEFAKTIVNLHRKDVREWITTKDAQ